MSEDEIHEPTEESKINPSTETTSNQKTEPTSKPFKVEVLDKVATLIAAALGFVAAFSWNETFKIVLLGGIDVADKPLVMIFYALFVTILAVVLTIVVARAAAKARKSLQ